MLALRDRVHRVAAFDERAVVCLAGEADLGVAVGDLGVPRTEVDRKIGVMIVIHVLPTCATVTLAMPVTLTVTDRSRFASAETQRGRVDVAYIELR